MVTHRGGLAFIAGDESMGIFSYLSRRYRGATFERLAEHFLQCQHYRCVARNFRSFSGEIDLIMLNPDWLAFVEVRYRQSDRYGTALDSIDPNKQRRIIHTAENFLKRYPRYQSYDYRFDAIVIGPNYLHWYQHAF